MPSIVIVLHFPFLKVSYITDSRQIAVYQIIIAVTATILVNLKTENSLLFV